MTLSNKNKRNIKSILIFTVIIALGSAVNAFMEHGLEISWIIYDVLIGITFGLIIGITEIYFFERKFRRVNFTVLLLIRTVFYVFVAVLIIILIAASDFGESTDKILHDAIHDRIIRGIMESEDFNEIILYTVVLSFIINFIRQINHLLGQRVLLNYAAGKYHSPIEEDLIVMFLDLKSSTTIAEKLGLIKNHRFLDDFFYDLTDPILESKCRIYQYVGDEIVIVWKVKDGVKNLNCVNLFWDIEDEIESKKDIYLEKYGVYPEFKAGLHCGKVITGEIGYIKKDIVYHGDTMNTASRIQSECNTHGKKLLISEELLNKLKINSKYKVVEIGSILLRGKEEEIDIFSIETNEKS